MAGFCWSGKYSFLEEMRAFAEDIFFNFYVVAVKNNDESKYHLDNILCRWSRRICLVWLSSWWNIRASENQSIYFSGFIMG